jgi:hypothetical protein
VTLNSSAISRWVSLRCSRNVVNRAARLESSPQNINLDILDKLSQALERPVMDLVAIQTNRLHKMEGIAPQIEEAIRQLKIAQAKIGG